MTLRVCIVDDDQDIRESLRTLFEDNKAIVEEAADGEAALALLRALAVPRVLLLDRMMPRLDGLGVLRALAQQPDLQRRTAILFMTARHEPPTAALAELLTTLGGVILTKPYDIDVLLGHVERAWQRLINSQ
jgi:CheY-like chemotaxis protein